MCWSLCPYLGLLRCVAATRHHLHQAIAAECRPSWKGMVWCFSPGKNTVAAHSAHRDPTDSKWIPGTHNRPPPTIQCNDHAFRMFRSPSRSPSICIARCWDWAAARKWLKERLIEHRPCPFCCPHAWMAGMAATLISCRFSFCWSLWHSAAGCCDSWPVCLDDSMHTPHSPRYWCPMRRLLCHRFHSLQIWMKTFLLKRLYDDA